MKCSLCEGSMVTVVVNDYHYECGLPHVYLGGIPVSHCDTCGEEVVCIPKMKDLHRNIAQTVANKEHRLSKEEIRFLRKWLGMSGTDFAKTMHVTKETVSRWENGHEPMGQTAEAFLRHMAKTQAPRESYADEVAATFAPLHIRLAATDKGWAEAVAP